MHEYGITLQPMEAAKGADCIIVAVAHNEFKSLTLEDIADLYGEFPANEKVLVDVKGLYTVAEANKIGFRYWRL